MTQSFERQGASTREQAVQRKSVDRSVASESNVQLRESAGAGLSTGGRWTAGTPFIRASQSAAQTIQMLQAAREPSADSPVQLMVAGVAAESLLGTTSSARPVQLRGGPRGGGVQAAAAHGTRGSGGRLPHFEAIQASFGGYDVSNVQAYTGGAASEASQAMGAEAYATGNKVAFDGAPSLHTAAHEAAHVIQQQAGVVSLAGGVGRAGDRYEQHADRVADAVVAGRSAAPVLAEMAGPTSGGAGGGLTQRVQWLSGPVQMRAREDYANNFGPALAQLGVMMNSVKERQKDATRRFRRGLDARHVPDWREQAVIGILNLALGAVVGSVGQIITATGGRVAAALGTYAATRAEGTMGTDNALDAGVGIETAINNAVTSMVTAGTAAVTSSVTTAVQGVQISGAVTPDQFQDANLRALEDIYVQASSGLNQGVAHFMSQPDLCWWLLDGLFGALRQELQRCEDIQFNKLTDVWMANQATTIGLGTRAGVLQIELASAYPDARSFSVRSANIVGSGAPDETIRRELGRRQLKEIGVPKVIRMNGSMGYGIMDCNWNIEVHGGAPATSGPSISSGSSSPAERYLATGTQSIHGVNQVGPYGFAWLAAHQLGLRDLDNDDSRRSSSNVNAGARDVWNVIKELTPGTIGNSNW